MVLNIYKYIESNLRNAHPFFNSSAVNCIRFNGQVVVNYVGSEKIYHGIDDTKGIAFYIRIAPKINYSRRKRLTSTDNVYIGSQLFVLVAFSLNYKDEINPAKLEQRLISSLEKINFRNYPGPENNIKIEFQNSNTDFLEIFKEEIGPTASKQIPKDSIAVAISGLLTFDTALDNCDDKCDIFVEPFCDVEYDPEACIPCTDSCGNIVQYSLNKDLNMNCHEIKNASFERLNAPPADPCLGQNYFDTILGMNGEWDGTKWVYGGGGGGSGVNLLIDYVASENLAAFVVITVDGKNADSNNPAHRNKIGGIGTAAVNNTFPGQYVGEGEIQNPAWTWNIGDLIFLNGTSLSTIPPQLGTSVFSIVMGRAIKTDTINVAIGQSFGL